MTGSGRHPDDDTALWQKVTRGVTPYDRHAELTAAKPHSSTRLARKRKTGQGTYAAACGRLASVPEQRNR